MKKSGVCSRIAEAIKLEHHPVAIVLSNDSPLEALQFRKGTFGCVAALVQSAAKGKTAAFTRETFGCPGGGVGLGFGDCYRNFPGGIENFLSTGNPEFCLTETGGSVVSKLPDLEEGERYFKTPEIASEFIASLPIREVPTKYVLFKPLDQLGENEQAEIVVMLVDPDQLSALVVLANYARKTNDNVIIPFAAACHTIGIIPFREAESEYPRAVVGLTDITVRGRFPKNLLTFAIPYRMFLEMESNVSGSFLERHVWRKLLQRRKTETEQMKTPQANDSLEPGT